MSPLPVLYALSVVACFTAWLTARRASSHRPVAFALTVQVASDVAQRVLATWAFDTNSPPYAGQERVAFEVYRAAHLAWPFAVAALAVRVLAGRRAWPVAALYVVAWGSMAIAYPELHGGAALALQGWVVTVCVVVGLVAAGVSLKAGLPPTPFRTVAVGAILAELWTLLSAYLSGHPVERWTYAQMGYAIFFAMAIAAQGNQLWTRSRNS